MEREDEVRLMIASMLMHGGGWNNQQVRDEYIESDTFGSGMLTHMLMFGLMAIVADGYRLTPKAIEWFRTSESSGVQKPAGQAETASSASKGHPEACGAGSGE